MRKTLIISAYFFVFWILLPAILIIGARYLDDNFFTGMSLPDHYKVAGFMIFVPGFFLMVWSVIQFRIYSREFPVSATPADVVIQKGLYSIWRHPIYLFSIITVAGLALILKSYGFVFIMLPVFIIEVVIYIWFEEKNLMKRFGPVYLQYRRKVGLFIPRLHHWLKIPAFIVFRFWFNIRIYNKKNIPVSPPFFVVASHRNYLDPFFLSYLIPWPLKHLSTFEMFRKKSHRKIFPVLGAIAKRRYCPDLKSMNDLKSALDQGFPVGVFPEGERSWTGRMQSLKPESMRMFILFRHIPILPVRIEGNYHSWPRWSPRLMRAKVQVSIGKLIEVPEGMGTEELERLLVEQISPRNSVDLSFRCTGKNIIGNLSRVLYRCPACRTFDSLMEIPPRTLQCGHCGQIVGIDRSFNLNYFENGEMVSGMIADLYNKIKMNSDDITKLMNRVPEDHKTFQMEGFNIIYEATGSFFKEQDDTLVLMGKGKIHLSDQGIHFVHNGEIISLLYTGLGAVTIESYYKLQMYMPVGKQLYQLTLERESVLKWQDTIVLMMQVYGLKTPVTR